MESVSSIGSLIFRVDHISGPLFLEGKTFFLTICVGGCQETVQFKKRHDDEETSAICILEQFVFPIKKSNEKIRLRFFVKTFFSQKKVAEVEVSMPDKLEVSVSEVVSFKGGCLKILMLKTTRTQQQEEEEELTESEMQQILDDIAAIDDDVDDWFVVGGGGTLKEEGEEKEAKEAERERKEAEEEDLAPLSEFLKKNDVCCFRCKTKLSRNLVSLDCFHLFCLDCFRNIATDQIKRGVFDLRCEAEDCECSFPDFFLRKVLNQNEMEMLLDWRAKEIISKAGQDLSHCPKCKMVFEASESEDDKSLSEQENCKKRNRFRCVSCSYEWCIECNVSPYHENHTCQSYEEYKRSKKCRFCDSSVPVDQDTCKYCKGKLEFACDKELSCGHACGGCVGEAECPPCLKCESSSGDEFCTICFIETLSESPVARLQCGHMFHWHCLKRRISTGFNAPRIVFNFLNCANCNVKIDPLCNKELMPLMKRWIDLEKQLKSMSTQRLKHENREKDKEIQAFGDATAYAMHIYSYYLCKTCQQPYFAGLAVCGDVDENQETVCSKCKMGSEPTQSCSEHGSDFIIWKCRYCCSVARFKCWDSHSFCLSCHDKQMSGIYLSRKDPTYFPLCKGPEFCPLKVKHPHCEEFCLGCSVCNSINF